jgi:hypothetical protein
LRRPSSATQPRSSDLQQSRSISCGFHINGQLAARQRSDSRRPSTEGR